MEASVWYSESHSKLLYSNHSLVWLKAPSLLTLGHQHWVLTGILPGHPITPLCCGDPAALGPQDWWPLPSLLPLILPPVLQQITCGVHIGVGQHKNPGSGPG